MQTTILEARVTFHARPFLRPLQLSSGNITEITEAQAEVRVAAAGKEAVGRGAIYLSDLWAWPDPLWEHAQRDQVLRKLCSEIAENLPQLCGGEPAHPIELGLRLHRALEGDSVPPVLARAMCGSPFDAAIQDAAGLAAGVSAFRLCDEPTSLPSADPFFAGGDASAAIRAATGNFRRELPAWLVVGKSDSMEDVRPWVRERGYRRFKLKITGADAGADAARTAEVYRAVRELGVVTPRLSIDSNEANPDRDSVLDYLGRLRAADAEACAALDYIEQPTGRDIRRHSYDWRPVTRLKPVFLDEGLTSLDLLEEAKQQGWNGFALKTCKGHSFALVAAAWALRNGIEVSVQDLTNPNIAAIHSALLAAHLDCRHGVEINSPQFTPCANRELLPRLAGLLEPQDGLHRLPARPPAGLGSIL